MHRAAQNWRPLETGMGLSRSDCHEITPSEMAASAAPCSVWHDVRLIFRFIDELPLKLET
jgi:hypothetical protein